MTALACMQSRFRVASNSVQQIFYEGFRATSLWGFRQIQVARDNSYDRSGSTREPTQIVRCDFSQSVSPFSGEPPRAWAKRLCLNFATLLATVWHFCSSAAAMLSVLADNAGRLTVSSLCSKRLWSAQTRANMWAAWHITRISACSFKAARYLSRPSREAIANQVA